MFQPSHTELVQQVAELRALVVELDIAVRTLVAQPCASGSSCSGEALETLSSRVDALERFILDPPTPAPSTTATTEPAAPAAKE